MNGAKAVAKLVAVGLAVILLAACGDSPPPEDTRLRDRFGDPLPEGAIARLGTLRFREAPPAAPASCLDADDVLEDREVAVSPDGRFRATIADDRLVLARGDERIVVTPRRANSFVLCLAFSPNGETIAIGRSEGTIVLVATSTGRVRRTLVGHEDDVSRLRFDESSSRLVSASDDRTVRLWDADSGACRGSIRVPEDDVEGLAVGEDVIRLWGELGFRQHGLSDGSPVSSAVGHREAVRMLAISRDGRYVATTGGSSTYLLWDLRAAAEPLLDESHVGDVTGLAFSPDGKTLASTGDGGAVRLRRLAHMTTERTPDRHYMDAYRVVGVADRWLMTGGIWGSLRFWKWIDGAPDGSIDAHRVGGDHWRRGRVSALAASPGGLRVASAAHDETIELHRVHGGELLAKREHGEIVQSLSFSADGFALAAADGEILVVLDGLTLDEIRRLTGEFMAATYAPDGAHLATGDAAGRLRLHDATSLEVVAEVAGHEGAIRDLAYSADGARLVTASEDGTLLVWDMERLLGSRFRPTVVEAPIESDAPENEFDTFPAEIEGLQSGEKMVPYPGFLPGTEPEGVVSVVVLDGVTGLPREGARVMQYAETEAGPASQILCEATADEFGVATLRGCETWADEQWVVNAPDRVAASMLTERPPATAVLFPGVPGKGRLLNPFGRAARGVEVELFLGCGHSPAAARAVTDEKGDFTFPHVNPEANGHLWFVEEGFVSEYLDAWPLWSRGDGRTVYVARPGVSLSGEAVDKNGLRAPGLRIKSRSTYRGPWAIADEDGRYALHGLEPFGEVYVKDADPDGSHLGEIDLGAWFKPNARRRILRPDVGREIGERQSRHEFDVSVRVVDEATGKPLEEGTLRFLEHDSGRVIEVGLDEPDEDGTVNLALRRGTHTAAVGGPFTAHVSDPVTFEARVDDWPPLEIVARRQPVLALEIADVSVDDEIRLVTPFGDRTLDPESDQPVYLPADRTCVLHVQTERARGMRRVFPIGPAIDGVRRVRAFAPRPHRILFRDLPADADLDWQSDRHVWSGESLGLKEEPRSLLTRVAGRLRIRLRDDDLGLADVEMHLPEIPGEVLDAPPLVWREERWEDPVLLLADGSPAVGARVEAWSSRESTSGLDGSRAVDAFSVPDGVPDGMSPFETLLLEAHRPGLVPILKPHAPGHLPTIRWGSADVRLMVDSTDGEPLDFVVLVDGALVEAEDEVTLGGMSPGKRRLIVGAKGYRSEILELELKENDRREITLSLSSLTPR